MANEYWLSDRQWAAIEPLLPMNRRGMKPRDNRRVISGILHVLKSGCRGRDCPEDYGPHTTVYNRFKRWSKGGVWPKMMEGPGTLDAAVLQCIDSTSTKAGCRRAGGKGGRQIRPLAAAAAGGQPKSIPLPTSPGV
ncbi:MAG: transposase [Rhodopila sp.]|nr:transposase [Rhodopila sp.]